MGDAPTDRDPLEELATDFLDRCRRGESPSVQEYVSRHPELAEEIRDLFPTLAAVERLKVRAERSSGGLVSMGPVRLERLGDFRIIREIGRGGMGVVFEAEQEALGRRVALKVLPPQALLEARHLARFQREAKIASRLHHTNIVQVYGVGEQGGFHYYVMQHVCGVGLDRVIARLAQWQGGPPPESPQDPVAAKPDPELELLDRTCRRLLGTSPQADPGKPLRHWGYYRNVAAIAEQAAAAIAYAHDQGTLHRDIKPSNLLLDDQGVVWLTDFGLARAADAPEVTQHGDLTGTLRYLAPERFRGQVDARGDIYGLGLTLYELLTLRPAYDEADRSALVRRVTHESPAPPRRLNPAVPRDLETVVLKAVSREPPNRYATAGAMAADLRRFQEDRPVLARRIGAAERLWRWGRRNRAVACLSAASLLLLVAVAAVATVGYVRTKHALSDEGRQRQRAEATAALAREALDRVFQRLGPVRAVSSSLTVDETEGTSVEVPGQPILSKEAAALLEEMLPFYDRLAAQGGEDPSLRARAAEATRRVGDIRQRLGQYDQAEAAYRRAIRAYSDMVASGEGLSCRLGMAEAYNELSRTYRLQQRMDGARQANREALAILTAIPSPPAQQPGVRFELARTYYHLGMRPSPELGDAPAGPRSGGPPRLPSRDDALRPPPPYSSATRPFGPSPEAGDTGARSPWRPGRGPWDTPGGPTSRPGGAPLPGPFRGPAETGPRPPGGVEREYLQKAVAILKGLVAEQPKNPEYRHLLALCHRDTPPLRGRRPPVSEGLENAIQILEQLARDFPQVPDYRFDLCETYAMGEALGPAPGPDTLAAAEQRLGKALTISQELVAQYPTVPEYRASQARIHHRLAQMLRRVRRNEEAEKSGRRAIEIQTALATEFPEVLSYQVWLAAYRNSLVDTLLVRDDFGGARPLLEETIAQAGQLLRDHPDLWYVHALLAHSHRTLAPVLRRNGEDELAGKAEQAAEEHRRQIRAGRGSTRPSKGPSG